MAVADTSIQTYSEIRRDGTLSRQQRVIVDAILPGRDYSLQELVHRTGFPINTVSGRCCDLRNLGVLELGPTRPCHMTGRSIHPVRLATPPTSQGVLFHA